jgi:mannosyltransferase OCH1-like enzyme
MKRRTAVYGLASVLALGLLYLAFDCAVGISRLTTVDSATVTTLEYGIPAVVHQTWKVSVSPPTELLRWRNGCTKVNKGFSFRMYSDEALNVFTSAHHPRYLALFEHLHGVCKCHSV